MPALLRCSLLGSAAASVPGDLALGILPPQRDPMTRPWPLLEVALSLAVQYRSMIDPYDPPHPDGPADPEDVPGPPLATVSWLHDEEPADDEWQSGFRPHLEDPD
jgi:hypothetical protein